MATTEAKEKRRKHLEAEAAVAMDEDRLIKMIVSLAAEGRRLARNGQVEESYYNILRQIVALLPALRADVRREIQEEQISTKERKEGRKTVKRAKEVLSIIKKEKKYFLRQFDIVKRIAKYMSIKDVAKMLSKLGELKRIQGREQFMASVNKLNSAIDDLVRMPEVKNYRGQLKKLANNMRFFEADSLFETVKKLDPQLEGKNKDQVDWQEVRNILNQLLKDLRALVILIEQMENILGKTNSK